MRVTLYLTVLTLTFLEHRVDGYGTGAGEISCGKVDLKPGGPHIAGPSTPGVAPFSLGVSTNSFTLGSTITVTLAGVAGAQFKGFLLVARKADGGDLELVGTFGANTTEGTQVHCAGKLGNGLTHTDPGVKSTITTEWTAPSTPVGDVIFHYTVMRSAAPSPGPKYTDYFDGLSSTRIQGPNIPPLPAGKFSQDADCGVSKGCYSNCDVNNFCDWETTWLDTGDNYNISIKTTATGALQYAALGVTSVEHKMSPASVVACVSNGLDENNVVMSENTPSYTNVKLNDTMEGISSWKADISDGFLQCTFQRAKENTNPKIYNLTQDYYFIVARGPAKSTHDIDYHTARQFSPTIITPSNTSTDIRFPSDQPIPTTPPPAGSTTPAPAAGKFQKDPGCGSTKFCYSDCDNDGSCSFEATLEHMPFASRRKRQATSVTMGDAGDHFVITLTKTFSSSDNNYMALGFATKQDMDPASVVECSVYNGAVDAFVGFNPDKYYQRLTDPKEGLSNISGSYVNNKLSCTFTRVTASQNNSAQIYDLRSSWYLITAWGKVDASGPQIHAPDARFLTSQEYKVTEVTDVSLATTTYPLIKAHAILMIVAWMMCASVGLGVARFCKKMWPEGKLCGLGIWFAIHRGAMVLTFIMGLTSFVIIFIQVKGYSEIVGITFEKAHPIMGIVTTALLFINPFMSMLRCGPDDPRRKVFNWAHWFVGQSAHIIAGVTVTAGVRLPKAQMDIDTSMLVMLVYGVWHVMWFLVMSVWDWCIQRADSDQYVLSKVGSDQEEIFEDINTSRESTSGKSTARKLMVALHYTVLFLVSVWLIYLVLAGKDWNK